MNHLSRGNKHCAVEIRHKPAHFIETSHFSATDDLNSIYVVDINQLQPKPFLPSVSKQSIWFLCFVLTCAFFRLHHLRYSSVIRVLLFLNECFISRLVIHTCHIWFIVWIGETSIFSTQTCVCCVLPTGMFQHTSLLLINLVSNNMNPRTRVFTWLS